MSSARPSPSTWSWYRVSRPKARRWYVRISDVTPSSRKRLNARRAAAGLARSRCSAISPRPRRCRLSAVCAKPESSASRSQSRSGAIPASSSRSSSDSDTLELQESPLVLDPERAVRAEPVGRHDAMARDHKREAVAGAEGARGPLCVRPAGKCRQLSVRDRLASSDASKHRRQLALELGGAFEFERNVEEIVGFAGKVAGKPLAEGVARSPQVDGGARQLVVQESVTVEPDLPHAPTWRLVAGVLGGHDRNRRIPT